MRNLKSSVTTLAALALAILLGVASFSAYPHRAQAQEWTWPCTTDARWYRLYYTDDPRVWRSCDYLEVPGTPVYAYDSSTCGDRNALWWTAGWQYMTVVGVRVAEDGVSRGDESPWEPGRPVRVPCE